MPRWECFTEEARAALKAATSGTVSEAMVERALDAWFNTGYPPHTNELDEEIRARLRPDMRAALTAASLAAGTRADGLRQAAEDLLSEFVPRRYAPSSDPLLGPGRVTVQRTKLFALRTAIRAELPTDRPSEAASEISQGAKP